VKLLFLTQSLVHGGAERHAVTLANRLAERGHECHFAYIKDDASQLSRIQGAKSITSLQAHRYLDLAALRALSDALKNIQPTHVVAANPYALFYAWLARYQAGSSARLAATLHSTVLKTFRRRLQMLYYRPFYWSADWLVFVCEAQRRYWAKRKLFARRTDVIYNGVDTAHFSANDSGRDALRRALGFSDGDLVVGLSAVLRPEKNPLQLLEACALARRRGVAARALFIGDGPMRPALEAHAAQLGLAREALITGFQQDVRPLVGACDAVALCSTTETFSLAALEAMALGRPVVHVELGGAAEMIEHGRNGYLFAPGDTAAFADRLVALGDTARRRSLGARAREAAVTRFSERAMVERYEAGLEQLHVDGKNLSRSKREKNLHRPAGVH
jgi:glycosyltransferase involved in cell wall biosynthesis